MHRVCIEIATGRLIESQSAEGPLSTLIDNAVAVGFSPGEVEARAATETEYATLMAAPIPSLEEMKYSALEELKSGVTGVKFDLWPQDKLIDLSRPTGPAPGYTVEDRDRAYQQIDDLNGIRFQIAQEIQSAPDLETLQQIVDDYRSLYA